MNNWIEDRTRRFREYFQLDETADLTPNNAYHFELPPEMQAGLKHFNIEWHFVPPIEAVPVNAVYMKKLYPTMPQSFTKTREHRFGAYERLIKGHQKQQGCIIGVETTQ